jgi:transcriptional regulator with XRE-family HTH domain
MDESESKTTLDMRIKFISSKFNLTKQEIATKANLSSALIHKACAENKITYNSAKKIADTFNVSADWIYNGQGESNLDTDDYLKLNLIREEKTVYKISLRLHKFDTISEATVSIQPTNVFSKNGFYLFNIMNGSPFVYYVEFNPPNTLKLATADNEFIVTDQDFEKMHILGFVTSITKSF